MHTLLMSEIYNNKIDSLDSITEISVHLNQLVHKIFHLTNARHRGMGQGKGSSLDYI